MGFVLSHSPNRAMPEKKSTKRALPLSVALFCMERDKMSEYEIFKKAIDDLLLKNFVIEIEDGQRVPFHFTVANIFHLLGLHYITDMPNISGAKNKGSLVNLLRKDERLFQQIKKSSQYEEVRARMESFSKISEMLLTDKCKIIIKFDKSLVPETTIKSCYLLYKTEDRNTYHILGLASKVNGIFYPETYFVEQSKYYVNGQELLNCQINYEDFVYKRKPFSHEKAPSK